MTSLPRILVTGEHEGSLPSGIDWVSLSVLDFERLPVAAELIRAVAEKPFDWIFFTSPRAVRFWSETWVEHGLDFPLQTQVGCIGERTAEAAAQDGFNPDFYPTEPGSEAFLSEFEHLLSNTSVKPRILMPVAEKGRVTIPLRLRELGCAVVTVPLYRTSARPDLAVPALADFDAVVFTSPSSVDAVLAKTTVPEGVRIVGIGRYTSDHLGSLGLSAAQLPEGSFDRIGEVL